MITTRTAREYARVSDAKGGASESVTQQHDENVADALSRGVKLGESYSDDGFSASRYATKIRGDFAQLMADLESGAFGADELILWESSRGSREVGEWVRLIDACEAAEVVIYVTTHERTYNPAKGRDRKALLEDAVTGAYESEVIRDRALRATGAGAKAGRPHGSAPYGYKRRYDLETGKLLGQEPHPEEAPVVRQLFAKLTAGHSLMEIARDFEAAGVRTRTGIVFSSQHLRALALNPAYAGLRAHDPAGRKAGHRQARVGAPGVSVVKATWDGIVDVDQFYAVLAMLKDPKRITTNPGGARHLLSMIARCGVCGGPIAARSSRRTGEPEYTCRDKGCVRIGYADLNTYAETKILGYLARRDVFDAMAAARMTGDDELAGIRADIATLSVRLEGLAVAVATGEMSPRLAGAAEQTITRNIDDLRARETALTTPSALRGLLTPGADVASRWESPEMPVTAQREVARLLLSPDYLGTLSVDRRPDDKRHCHVPAHERVTLTR